MFLGVIVLQTVPLPTSVLGVLSPRALLMRQESARLLSTVSPAVAPLSFYSWATVQQLMQYMLVAGLFLAAMNILTTKRQFDRLLKLIIGCGLCISLYGLGKKYLFPASEAKLVFATFANKNHFAAYMLMIAPMGVGYALYYKKGLVKLAFILAAVFICASIFFSLSRAGSISLIVSLFVFFMLLSKETRHDNRLVLGGFGILTLLFVLAGGAEILQERFTALVVRKEWHSRWAVYAYALRIVRDFPFFGVGMGNFNSVFTVYKQFILDNTYFFYAHNDHLQLLVEAGIIGAGFYYAFLITVFKDIIVQLRTRRDEFARTVLPALVSGLIGVLIHSFFDFHFHVPAVSVLFWLLVGVLYKGVYTHFRLPHDHVRTLQ